MTAMFRGDRGKTGDHGQDGRQGPQGERGPGPTRAEVDAEADRIEDVREALAIALGEKQRKRDAVVDRHLRVIDRRVLVIASFVLFAFGLFFFVDERSDERFEDQIIANCKHQNTVLEGFAQAALTNPARSPEDRKRTADNFRELKSQCPPG